MIRKAVIAAAGEGKRMRPLTSDRPKPLLEISGRPFLYYALKNFKAAGIPEVIIAAGYKKEKMDEFAERYREEFRITVVDQFAKCGAERYGTALAAACAAEAIGQDQFIYVYADHIHAPEEIKKFVIDDELTYMGVLRVEHPERYGVAKIDAAGFLERIVEKPKEPAGNLVNIGIFKFTPEIFGLVHTLEPSERGEYELTDAVQALAEKHQVKVIKIEGGFHEFTSPEDIPKAENFVKTSS